MNYTIDGKAAKVNGKYLLSDFLSHYMDFIELWISFENGKAVAKVGNPTLNFSYSDGIFSGTKTTTVETENNHKWHYNILYFSDDNHSWELSSPLTLRNAPYHQCYDSDVTGYFQYIHCEITGDSYETASCEGSYYTDGAYVNPASIMSSYYFDRALSYGPASKVYEGMNIVFFKRDLTMKEVNLLRKIFNMNARPETFKPISASYLPKLSGSNELGNGLYPTTYFTPDDKWFPDNSTLFVDNEPYFPVEQSTFTTVMPENANEYDSVHITNLFENFEVGDKMPIQSYPIPFVAGETVFRPVYTSDNEDVAVIGGDVLYCKSAGTANITVTANNVCDTVTITVAEPPSWIDNPYYVPEENFSDTDYEANQDTIFDAIDYAVANGYNHVVYPKIDIHVRVHENLGESDRTTANNPYNVGYYLPSNMKIEFPEGSRLWFHKSVCDSSWAQSRNGTTGCGYTFFRFKGCERTEVYVHTLIGQRYDYRNGDGTYSDSEYDYSERIKFCGTESTSIDTDGTVHKGANYRCKVEIEKSTDVLGFHNCFGGGWRLWDLRNIVPAQYEEGKTPSLDTLLYWEDGTPKDGRRITELHYDDFEQGTYDDNGNPVDDSNWIRSTRKIYFHELLDLFDSYSFGKYDMWNAPHTGRMNKILWLDDNENVVKVHYIPFFAEYKRPESATHFLVACATPNIPTEDVTGGQGDVNWARMNPGCADKFWSVRYGHNTANESGVLSITGYCKGMRIYDSTLPTKGRLNDWTIDFEDGWYAMQDNYIENCYVKQFVNHGTNLTANNCYFECFQTSSYSARPTVISSYIASLYAASHLTQEKENQTYINCNLKAACYTLIEESSMGDRIALVDCEEPATTAYDILNTNMRGETT